MDGVIGAAERHGIGLVPSLFWSLACVPDFVGEPMNQWGNPESKTIGFMREYVREVVSRYKDSAAIWAWEFGNEFSLVADLPNAAENRPPVVPSLGTAGQRSSRDDLSYEQIRVAFAEFARAVRAIDPGRPISTGDAILRDSAWHHRVEHRWAKDSPEQFAEMVALVTPEPTDLVSIHCYGDDLKRLEQAAEAAARLHKPLLWGNSRCQTPTTPSHVRAWRNS